MFLVAQGAVQFTSIERRSTIDFDFQVVVLVIIAISLAVETDITGLCSLGIYQPAFVGYYRVPGRCRAQASGVVDVVVKEGLDVGEKIGIICDLYNDIEVHALVLVIVPA